MKIAIITDQHFGARKNSKLFHDYFLKFYNDVFFPTLESEGITSSKAWSEAINTPWSSKIRPHFKDHIRLLATRYERHV